MISLPKQKQQGHTENIRYTRSRQFADWGQSIKPQHRGHSLPSFLYPSQ
jgi:hypothetical protein